MIYHINEFEVESDIPIPGDPLSRRSGAVERLTLRRGSVSDVPCTLRRLRRHQFVYDVGDGFLMNLSRLSLHVDFRGTTITVDCAEEKLPLAVAWSINAAFGAVTLFKGGIPLHGSGLMLEGHYFVLTAASGVGKSTLSWHLVSHEGACFGNDDLVPIRMTPEGPICYPSVSMYPKLQREAVDRSGLNPDDLLEADYGRGEEEYFVPLPAERRTREPAPLSAIFVLNPEDRGARHDLAVAPVMVTRLPADEAVVLIRGSLHAARHVGRWLDEARLTALCRQVAERTAVFSLSYVRTLDILPLLAQSIRCCLRSLGN